MSQLFRQSARLRAHHPCGPWHDMTGLGRRKKRTIDNLLLRVNMLNLWALNHARLLWTRIRVNAYQKADDKCIICVVWADAHAYTWLCTALLILICAKIVLSFSPIHFLLRSISMKKYAIYIRVSYMDSYMDMDSYMFRIWMLEGVQ